jgi:hypothetical protein
MDREVQDLDEVVKAVKKLAEENHTSYKTVQVLFKDNITLHRENGLLKKDAAHYLARIKTLENINLNQSKIIKGADSRLKTRQVILLKKASQDLLKGDR